MQTARFFGFLERIEAIASSSEPSVSALARRLQREVLDDDEFHQFLWERYGYCGGNVYVLAPEGPTESLYCLHRGRPESEAGLELPPPESQIQLPWLNIFNYPQSVWLDATRDRPQPFGYRHWQVIAPRAHPSQLPTKQRDALEGAIANFGSRIHRLVEAWDAPGHRLAKGDTLIVAPGEILFFRLFEPSAPAVRLDDKEARALRAWIDSPEGQETALRVLSAEKGEDRALKRLLSEAKAGTFRPSAAQVDEAKQWVRCDPVLQADVLGVLRLAFFPAGRMYTNNGVRRLFCLLMFWRWERIRDERLLELTILFRKIVNVGVELPQQEHEFTTRLRNQVDLTWEDVSHGTVGPINRAVALVKGLNVGQNERDKILSHLKAVQDTYALHRELKRSDAIKRQIANGAGVTAGEFVARVRRILADVHDYGLQCGGSNGSAADFDPESVERALVYCVAPGIASLEQTRFYFHEIDNGSGEANVHGGLLDYVLWEEVLNAFRRAARTPAGVTPWPIFCSVYYRAPHLRVRIANSVIPSERAEVPTAPRLVSVRDARFRKTRNYHVLLRERLGDFFYREVCSDLATYEDEYRVAVSHSSGQDLTSACLTDLPGVPLFFRETETITHTQRRDMSYFWVEISLKQTQ
jgi:hypothetical protein